MKWEMGPWSPSDQAVSWLRTISAEEFAKSIRDHQIQDFSRCLIEGDVDLNAIDYPHKLVIHDSLFRGRFDVGGAHFAKSVDLSHARSSRALISRGPASMAIWSCTPR